MSDDSKLNGVLAEAREKGHLPALDANVSAVCSLTSDPLTGSSELTSVILRDPALTTNIISTANSILYHPAEPVTTVSSAILILGFERVRTLTLGLGLFKQIGLTVKDRNLYRLLVHSYLSGMFAMALAQRSGQKNTEEFLVAGILSQLPRLLLAHTFPERYATLEKRMASERIPLEKACQEVFETSYHGLGDAIADYWGLPASVTRHLRGDAATDSTAKLLNQASQLAGMLAGGQPENAAALSSMERELQRLLNDADFKMGDFIKQACEADPNVNRFFHLGPAEVDRMLRLAERGKGGSAEAASNLVSGTKGAIEEKPPEDPSALVGSYLTELTRLVRRNPDINRVLFTGLEAIYRCVRPGVVLLAFPDAGRRRLEGRFLLGTGGKASDFHANPQDPLSAVARCLKSRQSVRVSALAELPGSFLARTALDSAFLVPIVVARNSVGLCVIARSQTAPFSEQEELWIEAVVAYIAMAFERAG